MPQLLCTLTDKKKICANKKLHRYKKLAATGFILSIDLAVKFMKKRKENEMRKKPEAIVKFDDFKSDGQIIRPILICPVYGY